MLGDGGVSVLLRHNVPRVHTVIIGAGGGVEADGPHHRHTDLAAHIQQATGVVQKLLLDADDVAVLVVNDTLIVDGAAVTQQIITHRLEVVDLAIDLIGTHGVHSHLGPAAAFIFHHQLVTRQAVAHVAAVKPREPDAVDETVALQNLLDEHGLAAAGPSKITAGWLQGRHGERRAQQQSGTQQGQYYTKNLFHSYPPIKN